MHADTIAESDTDNEWEYLPNRTKKKKEGVLNADNKQKSDNPSNTKRKKRHTSRRVDRENIRNRWNDMEKPAQAKTEVIHERDQEPHFESQSWFK